LKQAEARSHILEGFAIILDNLDEAIRLIRAADDTAGARAALMERFQLTERQTNAILEMRLRALTSMERQRVMDELAEIRAKIEDLVGLLASDARVLEVVLDELREIREKYGDDRRTEITGPVDALENEDLIAEEEMVVTISHLGYVKRNRATEYRAQRRGGKGLRGMETRDEDFVARLFVASTHAYVLFFTNRGRVHWKKVWELPLFGKAAKGRSLANLLTLTEGERVQATLPVRSFDEAGYVVLCTRKGVIKKTDLSAFSNPRRAGIIAINLDDDDELIAASRTTGTQQILIATRNGKSVRFEETDVRPMGRNAMGVRGVSLVDDDRVVGMEVLTPGATVLSVTENGFGKRTPLEDYRLQKRGGMGIITIRTSERNGPVIGVAQVTDDAELMLITDGGKVLRCRVSGISTMGRATQGVTLMDTAEGEKLVAIAQLAESDEGTTTE